MKINKKNDIQGIFCMLAASTLLSILSIIMSKLSNEIHPFQIFFLASLVGLTIITSFKVITRSSFKTDTVGYYILRAFFATITMVMWIYVLKIVPVTEATSISYITPLLNVVAAVIILREKLTFNRIIVIFIGFIGVMIVFRPGFESFKPGYILALITTIIWMITDLLAKVQSAKDEPIIHCFYVNLFMTLFSLPFAIYKWEPITSIQTNWIFLLGIVQLLNIFFFLQAYYKADMAKVSPYDFTRVVVSTLLAYILWDEVINMWSAIGVLLVLASVLYLTRLELTNRRRY